MRTQQPSGMGKEVNYPSCAIHEDSRFQQAVSDPVYYILFLYIFAAFVFCLYFVYTQKRMCFANLPFLRIGCYALTWHCLQCPSNDRHIKYNAYAYISHLSVLLRPQVRSLRAHFFLSSSRLCRLHTFDLLYPMLTRCCNTMYNLQVLASNELRLCARCNIFRACSHGEMYMRKIGLSPLIICSNYICNMNGQQFIGSALVKTNGREHAAIPGAQVTSGRRRVVRNLIRAVLFPARHARQIRIGKSNTTLCGCSPANVWFWVRIWGKCECDSSGESECTLNLKTKRI